MPATSPPPNPFNRQTPGGAPPRQTPRPGPSFTRRWIWAILALLLVNVLIANLVPTGSSNRITIPYTQFKDEVQADNVTSITATADQIDGSTKKAISTSGSSTTSTDFHTVVPSFTSSTGAGGLAGDNLEQLLEAHHVQVTAQVPSQSVLLTLLLSFGPTILLIGGFILLSRAAARATGGAGIMGFGRSTARLYDAERPSTTFADVAGIDDAKEELVEVVDFLREPQKYQRLGGTVPKGVLLVGLPGTGKTLLARAVAGEARVPFFSISASEFVEAIVGVGAARVRDLFVKARAAAPAIVFIDELDAVGRSRATAVRIGGHDEQEQTLNQILTEMDGFDSREGVIVIAATNRADVLDEALLRPGRFDRRVYVSPPDRVGRAAILRIHARGVPLAPDADLDGIAQLTPGLVGADLRNLVNEAALLAARRGHDAVTMDDFAAALEKIQLGTERRVVLSDEDRERIAYHESGHALLGLLVPGSDPVRRVSIVPRGRALGVTVQSPVDDRQNYPEPYLRARITAALGGRAAESIVYGVVTTGAENDLLQVTRLAHEMVARWGMSDKLGPINFGEGDGDSPFSGRRVYSEQTAELIDAETRRIIEECLGQACSLLSSHRAELDTLVKELLAHETLNEGDILRVTGIAPPPKASPAAALAAKG
ncbi:MAG TPA: ATP-dependent zinc metalloprotease FtsH [Candidatus Dormibacteraeota bacterium]|nr:ATP-dependent zinc metalloprotease FtsH [Candidatus Dormibacteraeota bacterium]